MIAQPYQLYVERIDPSRNMARFYALSIEATLFGHVCLIRRWGRIGARGRTMQHSFDREDDAVRLFLDLLRQKRKRGYAPKAKSATRPTARPKRHVIRGRRALSASDAATPAGADARVLGLEPVPLFDPPGRAVDAMKGAPSGDARGT